MGCAAWHGPVSCCAYQHSSKTFCSADKVTVKFTQKREGPRIPETILQRRRKWGSQSPPPHFKTLYGCVMLAEGEPHRRAEQKNPDMDPNEFSRLTSEKSAEATQQKQVTLLAEVLGRR